jgi:hypothetical protein
MDLARLDGQVDVVVCDEVTEALGDAAQFESQPDLLMSLTPYERLLILWDRATRRSPRFGPRSPADSPAAGEPIARLRRRPGLSVHQPPLLAMISPQSAVCGHFG